ncbi:hypothetical protein WJX75_007212 [Coccomyxa subellipsoidea]|uniref:Dolichol-phosphate mannosyltransferase subunit 3 n=1 Tax=Coccomyxa subellipsoidea TaxID=248742 RepID=A0ABR2YBL7_9CHLO
MLRISRLLSYAAVAAALWIGVLQLDLSGSARLAVIAAPFAALVLFGLYMLALLAHGVATYRDCPDEAESLQQDIAWALSELTARGVIGPNPLPEVSE